MIARLVPRLIAREYEVHDRGAVIGSSESADVRDTDRSVQPRHARLSRDRGTLWIDDLNSATGTFVNGRQVDGRAVVVHGDVLRCGTSPLELVCMLGDRSEPEHVAAPEAGQLRARIAELEDAARAHGAHLAELRATVGALGTALDHARDDLAQSRELHDAALAELRHQLAEARREVAAADTRSAQWERELGDSQALVAQLRGVIDGRVDDPDGGNRR